MPDIQLNDEVMQCFEDAMEMLNGHAETPLDTAALTGVVLEVGEAICLQLEKTRADMLEGQARLERMIEQSSRAGDQEQAVDEPSDTFRMNCRDG